MYVSKLIVEEASALIIQIGTAPQIDLEEEFYANKRNQFINSQTLLSFNILIL